ncbi:MAG TPA: type II secretion system protein GspE, partial [Chromatiales bacterium]|nr:type II secretion system protein GspE [Chromatiales bacterium]
FKVQAIDLANVEISDETLDALPRGTVVSKGVIPVSRQGKRLYVAMTDPADVETLDEIRFSTTDRVVPVVADEFSIESFLKARFASDSGQDFDKFLDEIAGTDVFDVEVVDEEDIAKLAVEEEVEAAPVVKLINRVLVDAVERAASDIHFEFYEHETRIRYRIDGSLIPVAAPPKKWDKALVSRLKIISKLNIGERRVPQDGRTKLKVQNRVVDFRVSTLPCSFGEKIVLRILDKSVVSLDMDNLGMEERELDIIARTIKSPVGMLLVTGPTGSGKTTTLYSVLASLNRDEVNLLTVEDPIEYDLPGINQVAVRPEVGLDFTKALKAFLRQDPDVIMVGEVRDRETADIAVRSALTGHLVLSTLHTNDAPSTITRLSEMGVERFNIATALVAIVAQRLVRRICTSCKKPHAPTPQDLRFARLSEEEAKQIQFKKGTGCPACDGTGYKGRIGLYELLPITSDIQEMIIAGATATEIKQRAIRDGMQTLRMTGMNKVRLGLTTLDEIIKHTTM